MQKKYPHLFSPVSIGKVTLRNRVVLAAMGMSLSDNGFEPYNIGDANGGGIIPNAVYEGYTVGSAI